MGIRRRSLKGRPYGKRAGFIRLLAFVLGAAVGILLLDMRLRPLIKNYSAYQARVYATKIINDSVYEELSQEDVRYENLVTVTQNVDGEVTSLQTDMVALGRLRGRATDAVLQRIANMEEQYIYISLGTLSGLQMLSGRGPELAFRVSPAGYLQTEIENRFDSAGINQTRHQIMLKMDMRVSAIIPGYTTFTEIHTEFCLAETVIVGTVPEAFTQVLEADSARTRQLFDYRAKREDGR